MSQNQWVSPAELTEIAEQQLTYKALKDPKTTFLLAITAGLFIGLGFVFYITVTTGAGDMAWGVSKLIGGLCFSLGLMLLVTCGGELFTSTVLTTVAWASRKASGATVLKTWVVVYFGNLVGSLLLVAIVFAAGQQTADHGAWGVNAMNIAQHKLHHTFVEAVALGILCNLMVCLAVWMSYGCKNNFEKALIVMMPVAMFVAGGFEHCVANMFMIPLGMSIAHFSPAEFWDMANVGQSAYQDLTISNFLLKNLLPVTIGNIIGGGLMVGLTYWKIYRQPHMNQAQIEVTKTTSEQNA
ncbi:formate transporter FocA [Gynuella sunshinyii]|uniref:Formate transporter FocA n=1 Tax=Gynuella sunshinyii YC6258 TaxID=1445510 RepID=A0A0C5VY16_9GAMM|nr:formate transporter FocA [Gynuella sunshinyii]AJQ95244.1 formate/nitrite family of transporter [Gynuella sunshinyii YC6258]